MGHRSERFRIRNEDATATKIVNRKFKVQERSRRDTRMMDTIKSGSLPYTPDVMSWLSAKLDKKSSRVTDGDVKTLLASA